METKKRIIIANWKMNPSTVEEERALLSKELENINFNGELVIAPPFVYLTDTNIQNLRVKNIKLGAQDVFWKDEGAYTGEISPKMLKDFGVEYVIISHSERRKYLNETDEAINRKVLASLEDGLNVVLCVGEDLGTRQLSKEVVEEFIKNQLQNDLKGLPADGSQKSKIIIAYEPIWAIGTKVSDNPNDAAEMIKFIKNILNSELHISNTAVLYGGSVNAENIKSFVEKEEIDGFLVGQASLNPDEFKKIIGVLS